MLVLRSDISKKLSKISYFVVNLGIFSQETGETDYGDIWNSSPKEIVAELESEGVVIFGFQSGKRKSTRESSRLGIKNHNLKGELKKELLSILGGSYSFKNTVFIGDELSDIELIRLSRFSVSTINSPLEIKMESDYVSNFPGIKAFEEVGNLILNAKRNYR